MLAFKLINLLFDFFVKNADFALLIVTSISVICAFLTYLYQKRRASKEAACDLAKYYAHEILNFCQFVNIVLTMSGKSERIKELFPMETLREFNYAEISHILTQKEYNTDEILKEITTIEPPYIFEARYSTAENIEERRRVRDEYLVLDDQDDQRAGVKMRNAQMLQREFYREVHVLLNDLEWFAMTCRYGLAEENILYQSLHQTYLAHVWMLYPYICKSNQNNEDKYYTNLIWLFNQWSSRLRKIKTKVQKKKCRKEQLVQKKKAALERAQKESEKVQAPVHRGKPL